jgi:Putative DNA-binding domain
MATIEDLRLLLQFPSENLSIEYKSWLDITDNAGKATLAKAAIALANEGGGIIVLGNARRFRSRRCLGLSAASPRHGSL